MTHEIENLLFDLEQMTIRCRFLLQRLDSCRKQQMTERDWDIVAAIRDSLLSQETRPCSKCGFVGEPREYSVLDPSRCLACADHDGEDQ